MQFNIDMFKQVVEVDVSELENFRKIYDKFLESVEVEYLETVFYDQQDIFIRDYCNGTASHNFGLFMILIVSKYCYEQGLKYGKGS